MSDELSTIARFNDLTQAQSARSALESAGIESILQDENAGSMHWGLMPALGGLRLQVRSHIVERALEVLGESGVEPGTLDQVQHSDLADPEDLMHRESARRRKQLVGIIAFLILFLPVFVAIILSLLT